MSEGKEGLHRVSTSVFMKNGRWFGSYRIGSDPEVQLALEVNTRELAQSKLTAFAQHAADEKDRARFGRGINEKPIWWRNGLGNREAGFEVARSAESVDVRLVMQSTSFLTAAHRVEPRNVVAAASEPQRDISFHEISLVPLGTQPDPLAVLRLPESPAAQVAEVVEAYVDEKFITQGSGWATFRRDGDWWAERVGSGELGKRRVAMSLSTSSDPLAGQRFYALQQEFRETPIDELLIDTFALRTKWARERPPVVDTLAGFAKSGQLGLSSQNRAAVDQLFRATAIENGDVKPAADTWLGVPIESGATVGDLRLRPALGGEWLVVLETEREPGDRDAVVVSGPRDTIDALTRKWIAILAALGGS